MRKVIWAEIIPFFLFISVVTILSFLNPYPPGEDWGFYALYAMEIWKTSSLTPSWLAPSRPLHLSFVLILAPFVGTLGLQGWRLMTVITAILFSYALFRAPLSFRTRILILFLPLTVLNVLYFIPFSIALSLALLSIRIPSLSYLSSTLHPALAIANVSKARNSREAVLHMIILSIYMLPFVIYEEEARMLLLGGLLLSILLRIILTHRSTLDPLKTLLFSLLTLFSFLTAVSPEYTLRVIISISWLLAAMSEGKGLTRFSIFALLALLPTVTVNYESGIPPPSLGKFSFLSEREGGMAVVVSSKWEIRPYVFYLFNSSYSPRFSKDLLKEYDLVVLDTAQGVEVLKGTGKPTWRSDLAYAQPLMTLLTAILSILKIVKVRGSK